MTSRPRTTLRLLGAAVALAAAGLVVAVAPTAVTAAPEGTGTGTGANGQALTVTPVDDLDPTGTELTVTGTGFTGAAGFDIATAGLYVALCVDHGVGETPTPCVGGIDDTGEGSASRWVTNNPYPGVPAVPVAADGSFETTITVTAADEFVDCANLPAGQACKVFARLDHRQSANRSQDVRVPVTFGAPAPPERTLTVSPATGLDPAGDEVVVSGTGYPTDAPGLYVVYGPEPQNSTDATPYDEVAFVPSSALGPDGSFTVTLSDVEAVYTGDDTNDYDFSDGGGFVSTFRAHGVPDPGGDWAGSTPVSFQGAAVPATTTALQASATSVPAGSPVVLTATVTTASSGTVDFRSGATSLGTATVSPSGKATRSVTFPTAGPRSVTAAFTGTPTAQASTSPAVTITVTAVAPPDPPDPTDPDPDTEPHGTGTGTGPNGQTLTVTPVEEVDPDGTEVEVRGEGYDAGAGFDIATDGMYVALCVDKGPGVAPSPCVGGVDTSGASGASKWVTNNPYDGIPPEALASVASDGSFETTITLEAADEYVDCLDLPAGERCVVATRTDHRASADRSQDVKVAICWAGEPACTPEVIPPADPDAGPAFTGYGLDPGPTGGTGGPGLTPSSLAATGASAPRLVPYAVALLLGGLALVLGARALFPALVRTRAVSPHPRSTEDPTS